MHGLDRETALPHVNGQVDLELVDQIRFRVGEVKHVIPERVKKSVREL